VAAGVTVNAICPGFVATELTWASARNIQERTGRAFDEAVQSLTALSPQKRLIEPEEVATLAVLLASDEARGVTAQAWNVDGGLVQA
jgi:3-hydroxybutyrate dehydrogenase